MENKDFYQRSLPHFQPLGGIFFVTYNLAESIPAEVIKLFREEYEFNKRELLKNQADNSSLTVLRKKHFLKFENFLTTNTGGPHYLRENLIAGIVAESLHYWDGKTLELICFCIMSNHVHVVIRLLEKDETTTQVYLHKLMQSIKQFSAIKANKILKRSGQFWQRESYDYQVKDREELFRIINYVLDNPVKAGLCESRDQWKWSYIKADYNEFI